MNVINSQLALMLIRTMNRLLHFAQSMFIECVVVGHGSHRYRSRVNGYMSVDESG